MRLGIYAIYDSGVQAFVSPFFARAKGEAVRNFMEIVKDGKSLIAQYPGDFALYDLGEFDDVTGNVTSGSGPDAIRLITAQECVPVDEQINKDMLGVVRREQGRKNGPPTMAVDVDGNPV